MKNYLYYFLFIALVTLLSCGSEVEKKHYLDRDYTIQKSDAYNQLMLDSSLMEAFIVEQALNDTLANGMRSFYNIRNYQYAWITPNGFTEQTLAFRNLYDYELDTVERKKLDQQLDHWIKQGSFQVSENNANFRKMELSLTWRYLNFLLYRNTTLIEKESFEHFPLRKRTLDSLVLDLEKEDTKDPFVQRIVQWNKNKNEDFKIPSISKKISLKDSNEVISMVKKKLRLYYGYNQSDTSPVYNVSFVEELKRVNQTFGINDSTVNPTLINELNIPIQKRIATLIINYERMKWLPEMRDGKHIIVNIPQFTLTAYNGNTTAFEMDVVVGKEGSSTVMFTGNMNNIVFAPYWNIPSSIVKNEILPAIENDKDYLEKNNMEIVNEEKEIPVIRQLPGDHNSLGKVKFLFPNSYNIYLHDTPNKAAFNRNQRALSHGCIRVKNPVLLANWVLEGAEGWNPTTIDSAMAGDTEKWVRVNPNIPVLIYYLTAYIDDNETLRFNKDIYGHDEKYIKSIIKDFL